MAFCTPVFASSGNRNDMQMANHRSERRLFFIFIGFHRYAPPVSNAYSKFKQVIVKLYTCILNEAFNQCIDHPISKHLSAISNTYCEIDAYPTHRVDFSRNQAASLNQPTVPRSLASLLWPPLGIRLYAWLQSCTNP